MGQRPVLKGIVQTHLESGGNIESAIERIESDIEQGIEDKVQFFSLPSGQEIPVARFLHEPPVAFDWVHDYGDTNNVKVVHDDTSEAIAGCEICKASGRGEREVT